MFKLLKNFVKTLFGEEPKTEGINPPAPYPVDRRPNPTPAPPRELEYQEIVGIIKTGEIDDGAFPDSFAEKVNDILSYDDELDKANVIKLCKEGQHSTKEIAEMVDGYTERQVRAIKAHVTMGRYA